MYSLLIAFKEIFAQNSKSIEYTNPSWVIKLYWSPFLFVCSYFSPGFSLPLFD